MVSEPLSLTHYHLKNDNPHKKGRKDFYDEYADGGHPVAELVDGLLPVVGKCAKNDTGTSVTFYPDASIFETVDF